MCKWLKQFVLIFAGCIFSFLSVLYTSRSVIMEAGWMWVRSQSLRRDFLHWFDTGGPGCQATGDTGAQCDQVRTSAGCSGRSVERARRASRDIGAGMGRSRSRALTPDPGHLVAVSPPCPGSVGAGAGTLQSSLRPPSPPRSSSASSWLHLRVSSLVSHFCPQSSDTAGTIRRQSVRARGHIASGQHQDRDNNKVGEQWPGECGGCCVCVIRSKAEDQIQFWNSRASLCAKLFTLATIGAKYFFNC